MSFSIRRKILYASAGRQYAAEETGNEHGGMLSEDIWICIGSRTELGRRRAFWSIRMFISSMAEKINISMAGDRRMRNVASVWRYLVYPSIGLKDHSCICFIPECRTLGLVIRGWSMQTGWNLSEWQEWPEANCCNIYPAGNKTKRPYRPPPINRTFQRLMKGKTLRGGERQKHLNCNSVFFRLYCLYLFRYHNL